MDTILVTVGLGLIVYALFMLVAYLWLERGSIFDPIVVSWVGYIIFVPVAMIGTGILYPDRDTAECGTKGCALMILGTLTYTMGLYLGKAIRFCRRLPRPHPTVSKAQIWVAFLISAAICPISLILQPLLVEIAGDSAGTAFYNCLFSITLISVIGLVMLRGSPVSRIVMGMAAVAACITILWTIFSKRPLAGVLITAVGLIYHFRIANSSKILKLWFFGGLMAALCVLVVYLDATRGERYYGHAAAPSLPTFSAENLRGVFGGVEMNYRVYEFALQQMPSQHPFLYGTGYVPGICWFPRVLWPSKPVGTAYVLSQMWFNQEVLATNLGLPTMGEAYANFGIPGIILILFLIGRLVRIMNTYLRIHYDNIIAWAAWLLVVPDVVGEWRGDFTSMTSQGILKLVGFVLVMWVARWLARGRDIRATNLRQPISFTAGKQLAWQRIQPVPSRAQRQKIIKQR